MDSRRAFLKKCLLTLPVFFFGGRAWCATAKRTIPPLDLAFLGKSVEVVPRSEWNRMMPKVWRLRVGGEFDRLTVHHIGTTANVETDRNAVACCIENVLTDHVERGYGDIGYHFLIDYAGRVWEGRPLSYEGAHVMDQNEGNIGVVLLGNFEIQNPSGAQIESLDNTVAALRSRFRIKRHRVYGHRDLGASVCPGKNLYEHVVEMKA